MHKLREKYLYKIILDFLLTKCWGYVIMEMPRVLTVDARPGKPVKKIAPKVWGDFKLFNSNQVIIRIVPGFSLVHELTSLYGKGKTISLGPSQ